MTSLHLGLITKQAMTMFWTETIIVKLLTRGSVMSPGAIGARERVPSVEALRSLRVMSIVVLHTAMLQPHIFVFLRFTIL